MSDESRSGDRITASIPRANNPPVHSFATDAGRPRPSIQAEPGEFVVVAHTHSGRVFLPFIVTSKGEQAARKLCRRNYLEIRSVETYVEAEGVRKPRTLPYGPPISDTDFEEDYGNRAPDPNSAPRGSIAWYGVVGGLLCGPVGALLGLLLHDATKEPRRPD